jgi:hypothetical protein
MEEGEVVLEYWRGIAFYPKELGFSDEFGWLQKLTLDNNLVEPVVQSQIEGQSAAEQQVIPTAVAMSSAKPRP